MSQIPHHQAQPPSNALHAQITTSSTAEQWGIHSPLQQHPHNQRVCRDHQLTDHCSERESPSCLRSSPLRLDPQACSYTSTVPLSHPWLYSDVSVLHLVVTFLISSQCAQDIQYLHLLSTNQAKGMATWAISPHQSLYPPSLTQLKVALPH